MWFRNLQVYRITSGNITLNELEEAISQSPLQPCMQTEMQSRGWMMPHEEHPSFVYALGQQYLIAFGTEKITAGFHRQSTRTRANCKHPTNARL